MIHRRKFIGSIAAFCAAAGSASKFAHATSAIHPSPIGDLKWACQVVETIPHNKAQRNPVVTGVALQSGGDMLAIVGDDHFVCLYDTQRKSYVRHLGHHEDWIRSTEFSPDGSRLATAGNDRTLCIWDTQDLDRPLLVKRQPEAIIHLAFSHNGSRVATVGFDSWLRIYDIESGEQLAKLDCACPDNHAVAYSPDDSLIAAGGRCGNVRVWETGNDSQTTQFKAHRQRIRTIEFTSDNKIVSAGDDQVVRVTDPANTQLSRSLPRQSAKLYATKLMDNNLFATAGSDNRINIWQLDDLANVGTLRGHTGTVTSLAYSDSQLVSGSYDTHVRIWSAEQHTSAVQQRHTELHNGWNRKLK